MQREFGALGRSVAAAEIGAVSIAARQNVDRGIRASLLCTWFGLEREAWVWPFVDVPQSTPTARLLSGLFEPLGGIGYLATVAGASDLDPMDPGPSHSVLPATLAACIAAATLDRRADDERFRSAVLAGVETAWRFRAAITARPGVGFHSPGVFGALAAAASTARMLGLDAGRSTNALAIALTRASGLAINSAASMIGLTHFGWGAFHGLEAGLLAAQGWGASNDFERGLASLYGVDGVSVEALLAARPSAAEALVFKRYPCNIYLNLLVSMLAELPPGGADRIEVVLPWVPHLDCPAPGDLRQARNSAQAVAAIAGSGGRTYAAFSGPPGPWSPSAAVARLLPAIDLRMDRAAPTGLQTARVGARAWRDGRLVLEAESTMRALGSWGIEHARTLLGPENEAAAGALYGGEYLAGFEYVLSRRASVPANPSRRTD